MTGRNLFSFIRQQRMQEASPMENKDIKVFNYAGKLFKYISPGVVTTLTFSLEINPFWKWQYFNEFKRYFQTSSEPELLRLIYELFGNCHQRPYASLRAEAFNHSNFFFAYTFAAGNCVIKGFMPTNKYAAHPYICSSSGDTGKLGMRSSLFRPAFLPLPFSSPSYPLINAKHGGGVTRRKIGVPSPDYWWIWYGSSSDVFQDDNMAKEVFGWLACLCGCLDG